ncbi:hypothetical protein BX616_005137 [Lobosporangium transversale]|uniref:Ferric reductase NAD binding domain-domain-containing protein n=1 Tax=Lobosporangium transversale TaxID=64571 RepID=A0A1Y2GMT1_9FUNG|nr:ferric reductase NAD binding domain-domain-containing protein [Lobosporangium transversale]KAF9897695.1 hypothetical protein BX616_005137 [Lobosporangium transversale]ORZ12038.1 ferric reductase NAD binding domain-domain-containing protein [Lobosporangium transversale]|eukprot:XP_021879903.1 ferric reductase NAD binding domain-domain-containing protein [Lobosporangium transversale]
MFKAFETWTTRRYAFFIIWFILHVILFIFGVLRVKLNDDLINLNAPLNWSLWVARGGGMCLIWDCCLILLPVCRNILRILRVSFINKLIPIDENIWFHKITAYSILFCTIVHTIGHYVNFYKMDRLYRQNPTGPFNLTAAELLYKSPAGITGHIMLLCMALMYTTAKQTQRHKSFESFWYTHHLAFIMLGALMFHGIGCIVKDQHGRCRGYDSYQYLAIGYVLYVIERGIRFYRARLDTRLVKAIQHPAGVIELQIQKPSFSYKPGQYMFINVPDVSKYQWHPFTITSSPFEDYVSVHIRQVGDWTRALGTRLGVEREERGGKRDGAGAGKGAGRGAQAGNPRPEKNLELVDDRGQEIRVRAGFAMPKVQIDGPFGAPTEDVFDHEIVVLVGSGIGVTPFASILRDIWYRANNNMPLKTRRVEFYWVSRDLASFKWFQSLLATIEQSMLNVKLKINIYCTAVMKPDQHHNIALHMQDEYTGGDTITGLQALTNFGRPNFGAIFTDLRQGITDGTYLPGANQELVVDVAVFFCGPGAMAKALRKECRVHSKNGVKFSFRKEHF